MRVESNWSQHKEIGNKMTMVVHICKPSTQEIEAGGSGVQYQPELRREFHPELQETLSR